MGALLGDEVVEAGPGDLVYKPRGQWHTFGKRQRRSRPASSRSSPRPASSSSSPNSRRLPSATHPNPEAFEELCACIPPLTSTREAPRACQPLRTSGFPASSKPFDETNDGGANPAWAAPARQLAPATSAWHVHLDDLERLEAQPKGQAGASESQPPTPGTQSARISIHDCASLIRADVLAAKVHLAALGLTATSTQRGVAGLSERA